MKIRDIARRYFPLVSEEKKAAFDNYVEATEAYLELMTRAGVIEGYKNELAVEPGPDGCYGVIRIIEKDRPEKARGPIPQLKFFLSGEDIRIEARGSEISPLIREGTLSRQIDFYGQPIRVDIYRKDCIAREVGLLFKDFLEVAGRLKFAAFLHAEDEPPAARKPFWR